MSTTTITAELVRNDRLHLSIGGATKPCAGRRIRGAVLTVTREVVDLPIGLERAAMMATERKATVRDLAAAMTDQHRANLCERCTEALTA